MIEVSGSFAATFRFRLKFYLDMCTGLDKKFRKALQKALSVAVIAKNVAQINTSDDNVLQNVRHIKAGGSWHVWSKEES